MREIRRRKDSIAGTRQITKAMKLVATVKLQKARKKAEESRPYTIFVRQVVQSILAASSELDSPWLRNGKGDRLAVIAITSNRGLAGGYNVNLVRKLTESGLPKDKVSVYAVGRKGRDALARQGYAVAGDYSEVINEPLYRDAMELGNRVLKEYGDGSLEAIYLLYTSFQNTVSHVPVLLRLLPVKEKPEKKEDEIPVPMNYEPDEETVLDRLIPAYVTNQIYGAFLESLASENGARMAAMDASTANAEEMMERLDLLYNRARQGTITQELTEIMAGAEAVQ